ncbi:peptide/nickel transport system ATP-binding protein [Agrobacterium larrymoorei]|uniref:Peptide/nickel transport system ATP-binding protein n=1 Tax=Agrobacterium larrymoorei TaxID=160699 RepID=A0AAJ2BCH6_9HYPH|nr:ABC transporter ATP-binding protein [Agrobacterium larrymoorei]MDR6100431.1 peptide/nickel transport system ATP-binding protein [Agrobacterium larrymoorei]
MDKPLIDVKDLTIRFETPQRTFDAVRGVSFTIGREKVGIVGESGSGKSQTGRALLKLTPKVATISAGHMRFKDTDLLAASEKDMRKIRGNRISMILQDPKYSLNPLMRIGQQIVEAYRLHHRSPKAEARVKALAMLESVQIRDPERVFKLFPHEVSGGMGQRIMIAMMLIPEPDLIIADEPTSALDVTVRRQVLTILDELVTRRGTGLMFISHDLNLVAGFCDRVLVMYAGRIMEDLPARDLRKAQHPYTQALLQSLPRLDAETDELKVPVRDPSWLDGPVYRNGVLV